MQSGVKGSRRMEKKLKLGILIFIVLFVVFNAFDCVEIWYKNWFSDEINLIPAGSLTKRGAIDNLFPVALIIGFVQLISLSLNKKALRIIGICGSVLGALFSLRIPFYAILGEKILAIMGGRGNNEYIASFFGYAVVIIAFALVVMQITLYHLTKKHLESQENLQGQ